MAVIAPLCKYKKTNYKIYMLMLIAFAIIFAYDGFLSKYKWSKRYSFYVKHVINNNNKPDHTMLAHQYGPPLMFIGAIAVAAYFWRIKDKKLVAEEVELVFSEKDKIPYSSIESVNKTNFETKGFFIIEYKLPNGQKSQRKISDRTYDNLNAVLEIIVSKITG